MNIGHDAFCDNSHLIVVYQEEYMYGSEVTIRWCQQCGAVVGDLDYDGRTKPGHIFHMRFPDDSKSRYEPEGQK